MGKEILHTVRSVMGCMLVTALAAGCAQEDIGNDPSEGGGMSATSYVSLSFASPQGTPTRSNPTGGETGDGLEKGQANENAITSAVAFFYQGTDQKGVNSGGTTLIKAVVSFNFNNIGNGTDENSTGVDRTYTTLPQQVDLENGTYNVIVVANPGTDWWTGRSLTLADVRDHIQTTAWTVSESGYSNFVMTSAADATLTLNSNPESDPATAEVDVERMAARLDYKTTGTYTCDDPDYESNNQKATVEITGAALVNNLTAGSYLLKRVAADVNGVPTYLGNETPDAGVQTNYVLDPWTAVKTSANNNFTIGGETKTAEDLYGEWFGNISQNPNYWAAYVQPGTSVSDGAETWQRIGYTLENTTAAEEAGKRYSTGVVFKAKFHPAKVTSYTNSTYTDGATFFAYGKTLYASMEDMMIGFYGHKFDNGFSGIEECKTWGKVRQFITSTLLTNDPSGYDKYLEGLAEGKADADAVADASSLTWSYYMLNECGYSKDRNGKVVLDRKGKVTRIALQRYGTRTYEDATCYYTWWVRHSNDNDDAKGIMEYAIVRNNIYKLTVESIYSLGDPVPGDEELNVKVYVNNWLLLDPETLPM